MSIGGFGEGWGGWLGCFPRRGVAVDPTARRRPCCGGGVWELHDARAVLKAGSA
jgi:hypothetical protein